MLIQHRQILIHRQKLWKHNSPAIKHFPIWTGRIHNGTAPQNGDLPYGPKRTKSSTHYPRVFCCCPDSGLLIHPRSWHNRSCGVSPQPISGAAHGPSPGIPTQGPGSNSEFTTRGSAYDLWGVTKSDQL